MSTDEDKVRTHDFSGEVKLRIPEWTESVHRNPCSETLQVALPLLLALEKKTRLAADVDSTVELARAIIALCHEVNDWGAMREQLSLLCKRRAQMPKVIQTIVKQAYALVEMAPASERADLLKTLREVSDGKIYVELERARMTRRLAEMEEAAGNLTEAATLLQETQAETIGSMEVAEKAELILEQIRLCLDTKDYIRAEIIMHKVTTKVLENKDLQPLKLKYYTLCIGFYLHSNRYLDACRAYIHIGTTPMVSSDDAAWTAAMTKACLLAVLAPWDSDVNDILHRMDADRRIERMPAHKQLITQFVTTELTSWPLRNADSLLADDIFTDAEHGSKRLADLRTRTTQHNLRVLAEYYSVISYARAADLLQLPAAQMETDLAALVSTKQLYAKIDRPAGVITFEKKKTGSEMLNAWSADIEALLSLVEDTRHLINRENMVHGLSA